MNDLPTGAVATDLALVRESARAFAARLQNHKAFRTGRFQLPWHEADRVPEMVALGWFGALIPTRFGGLGLDFATMATIADELGAALLAGPLVPLAVLAPRAILHGDSDALKMRLLPRIAEGRELVALGWQEGFEDARDPCVVATEARPDGTGWRVTGRKRFVAGAWAAAEFVVSARAEDGLRLFRIRRDAPGLRLSQEWRADGSPTGMLDLCGVRVAADDVAAGPRRAEAALQRALGEAAIIVSAELVGVMRAVLAATVSYMRSRVAFGRPIASFQALQHRAANMHVQREVAEAALAHAVRVADDGPPARDGLGVAASRAKARCNEAALRITRDSVQLHGAIGFTDECDIGLYLKRALVLSAWLGTTAAHHVRIAPYAEATAKAESDAARSPGTVPAAPPALDRMQAIPVARRDWNALTDAQFRDCARAFFAANLPHSLRFLPQRIGWQEIRGWYLLLSREGWLAPTWPPAYGGMGLNAAKLMTYYEEMERIGGPRLLDHGINNVGSILLTRGTEEQRRTYLPKILTGEHIWCQGYSEPNAGSDLASLRTEARLEGEEFVVTGQKIWTTFAHEANHMYALVRTDKARPGRDGISFLLLDLRQPGVTIRRIRNIAGHEEFCEVFLDGVRAHRSSIVGDLNDGWSVSRAVLGFERLRVGTPRHAILHLQRLTQVARRLGLDRDPVFRARLIQLTCDVQDLASLYERAAEALKAGNAPGPEASVLKIWATETEQRLTQALVEVLGDAGPIAGTQNLEGLHVDVLTPFLSTRAGSIYGGTNEVQRNIIARRILGL